VTAPHNFDINENLNFKKCKKFPKSQNPKMQGHPSSPAAQPSPSSPRQRALRALEDRIKSAESVGLGFRNQKGPKRAKNESKKGQKVRPKSVEECRVRVIKSGKSEKFRKIQKNAKSKKVINGKCPAPPLPPSGQAAGQGRPGSRALGGKDKG
jgi:hypothetical protein